MRFIPLPLVVRRVALHDVIERAHGADIGRVGDVWCEVVDVWAGEHLVQHFASMVKIHVVAHAPHPRLQTQGFRVRSRAPCKRQSA